MGQRPPAEAGGVPSRPRGRRTGVLNRYPGPRRSGRHTAPHSNTNQKEDGEASQTTAAPRIPVKTLDTIEITTARSRPFRPTPDDIHRGSWRVSPASHGRKPSPTSNHPGCGGTPREGADIPWNHIAAQARHDFRDGTIIHEGIHRITMQARRGLPHER